MYRRIHSLMVLESTSLKCIKSIIDRKVSGWKKRRMLID